MYHGPVYTDFNVKNGANIHVQQISKYYNNIKYLQQCYN